MSKALIWGAGGGIGRALTEELANQGWDVIGVARDADDLEDNVWLAIEADVSSEFAVRNAVLKAGTRPRTSPYGFMRQAISPPRRSARCPAKHGSGL